MPTVKDRCICQICVCGRHNCGNVFVDQPTRTRRITKFSNNNNNNNINQKQRKESGSIELPVIIEYGDSGFGQTGTPSKQISFYSNNNRNNNNNTNIIGSDDTETDTTSRIIRSQRRIRRRKKKILRKMKEQQQQRQQENEISLKKSTANTQNIKDYDDDEEYDEEIVIIDDINNNNNNNGDFLNQKSPRKTWKTSPEQVEELTRSLSRLRNDERGNRILTYEKHKTRQSMAAKSQQQQPQKSQQLQKSKKSSSNNDQNKSNQMMMMKNGPSTNKLQQQPQQQQQPIKHRPLMKSNINKSHSNKKVINNHHQQQQMHQGFLPPLTGFSDTDSSFSSIVCSSEDCDKIHCICETLKKTHLEEHEIMSSSNGSNVEQQQQHHYRYGYGIDDIDGQHHHGINYIDGNNHWIVTRPKRIRPRDNLKLEGQMEMETTFRSTYGRGGGGGKSTKQSGSGGGGSSGRTTRGSGKTGSPQQQLYLNTRRGRAAIGAGSGSIPILTSANKRKTIRNRPRTSLKLGGHGYWSTNNRDDYKNFIIINGEAKTIPNNHGNVDDNDNNDGGDDDNIKLPKVLTKTTMMTSEEKNRRKYDLNDLLVNNELNLNDEEIRKKFEKKSFITNKNGSNELMAEKLIQKVRKGAGGGGSLGPKGSKIIDDDDDQIEREGDHSLPDQATSMAKSQATTPKPYDIYQIDHIKDLGLLEIDSRIDDDRRQQQQQQQQQDGHGTTRQHLRRLHETSDDFKLLTGGGGGQQNGFGIGKSTIRNKSEPRKLVENDYERRQRRQQQEEKEQEEETSLIVNGHAVMAASKKPFMLPQRIQRHKNESSINLFEGDMEFTTTQRSSYRNGRDQNGSKQQQQQQQPQRKRTAGRRTLRSGKRRNLFRQSSDSIFARPESSHGQQQQQQKQQNGDNNNNKNNNNKMVKTKNGANGTTYNKEFGDQSLYCPVLDLNPDNDNFKITGGHKYFKSK